MKISIATILWGKAPDLDGFKRILAEIKEIGFDGVGFETRFLPPQILQEPDLLPEVVDAAGLENAGSYSSMKLSDVLRAARSNTPLLWLVVRREKNIRDALRVLSKFASMAQKESVIPALHNHLRSCFETEEELDQALQKIGNLKLCYDTAHAEAVGINQRKFVKRYHDKIALVHLKDLRTRVPRSRVSFTKDFVNVGSGIVDFKTVLSSLVEYKYRGHLMLELDAAAGKKPGQLAKEGYSRLTNLLSTT